ncbi:MAG TPA: TetR/AcrR family transcriptional regulator [Streptosporangiaceae bacterium]
MAGTSATTRRRLTPQDWVTAALAVIAEGGLAAVAVEPLAQRLGTSKGSFYWHFENRDALLTAALARWEEQYTAAVTAENTRAGADPVQRLRLLIRRVTTLAETDSVYVALIATAGHPAVAPVLTRITEQRIDYTAALFRDIGFPAREARYRSLLAYSAHLGHTELARSAPGALPRGRADREAYLQHVVTTLTTPRALRGSSRPA